MNNDWINEWMEEYETEFVTLALENGELIKCSVVGIFSAENGKEYIAFYPEETNTGEFILYRYIENEDGGVTLENIDDDAEFEMVLIACDEWLDKME